MCLLDVYCGLIYSSLCVSRRSVQTSFVWSSLGTGLSCMSVAQELTIQSVPLSTVDANLRLGPETLNHAEAEEVASSICILNGIAQPPPFFFLLPKLWLTIHLTFGSLHSDFPPPSLSLLMVPCHCIWQSSQHLFTSTQLLSPVSC